MAILLNRFNHLRNQLYYSFTLVALIVIVWVALFFVLDFQQARVEKVEISVAIQKQKFLLSNNNFSKFVINGYREPNFYLNNKQVAIDSCLSFLTQQQNDLKTLQTALGNTEEYTQISNRLIATNDQLNNTIARLRALFKLRGYKDYGLEGQLREAAHNLELNGFIASTELLSLRRLEKDFIIRNDVLYAKKLTDLTHQLLKKYAANRAADSLLTRYESSFGKLVTATLQIGLIPNNALHGKAQTLWISQENQYDLLQYLLQQQVQDFSLTKKLVTIVSFLLMLVSVFILSTYLVKNLTQDVDLLQSNLHQLVYQPNKQLLSKIKYTTEEFKKIDSSITLLTQKHLENNSSLYEQNERYSLFLNHLPVPAILLDMSGTIQLMNLAAREAIARHWNQTITNGQHATALANLYTAEYLAELTQSSKTTYTHTIASPTTYTNVQLQISVVYTVTQQPTGYIVQLIS